MQHEFAWLITCNDRPKCVLLNGQQAGDLVNKLKAGARNGTHWALTRVPFSKNLEPVLES